jgi:hypothetical protein
MKFPYEMKECGRESFGRERASKSRSQQGRDQGAFCGVTLATRVSTDFPVILPASEQTWEFIHQLVELSALQISPPTLYL